MGFLKVIKENEAYCRAKYAYLKGMVESPFPPAKFWIEPTNRCNLKCIMCPQREEMTRGKGIMKFSTFKKIIDEISVWKPKVNLYHSGESLLHPKIFEIIKYATESGCYINLATNGTLLDEEKTSRLINSGLDELRFSFDGATKEIYERTRVGANFEKVTKNISGFLRKKKSAKSKKPKVVVEIIWMKETKDHVDSFIERFKALGAEEVRVRALVDWAGRIKIPEIPEFKNSSYRVCSHPWSSCGILWDGSVVPCCYDFNASYIYGNLETDSFLDLWNSEAAKNLRELFIYKEGEKIGLCCHCMNALDGVGNKTKLGKINDEVFLVMMEEYMKESGRLSEGGYEMQSSGENQ